MDINTDPSPTPTATSTRHKCSACFKQYKKKEHLIEHMKVSCHSAHQPKCGVCQKHCKSFESLREHLTGPLAKGSCSSVFVTRGCNLCMRVFEDPLVLSEHKWSCRLSPPTPLGTVTLSYIKPYTHNPVQEGIMHGGRREAVALDCEMVGGGSDGSLDICLRVCLIDEDENVIFHSYVEPLIPITDYRYEKTGLTEEHLRDAMPLKEVQEKILTSLYNGESIGIVRLDGGNARLLVGHSVYHDLDCLRVNYPDHLIRYEIQTRVHDPYEDCVSAMRLYMRMRAQVHDICVSRISDRPANSSSNGELSPWDMKGLDKLTPDKLFEMSRPDYKCWCLDSITLL